MTDARPKLLVAFQDLEQKLRTNLNALEEHARQMAAGQLEAASLGDLCQGLSRWSAEQAALVRDAHAVKSTPDDEDR